MSRRAPSGAGATGAAAAATSAAAMATVTGACCTAPPVAALTVTLLGASGAAWAAGFQAYAPWLLAGSALALAYGFWSVHRALRACGTGTSDVPHSLRFARWALGVATVLWLAAVALNIIGR